MNAVWLLPSNVKNIRRATARRNHGRPAPLTFVPIVANLPTNSKAGIAAVKDHGRWMDRNWRALERYLMQKAKNDHSCVDEC